MKKILSVFFAAVMLFGLTSCNKSSEDMDAMETASPEILIDAPTESVSQPLSFSAYIPKQSGRRPWSVPF